MSTEQLESKLLEATAHNTQGKYADAERLCREVLDMLEVGRELTLRARALCLLAESLHRRGHYAEGLPIAEEALAAMQQAGDKQELPKAMNLIGNMYSDMSDYPRAMESYTKALAMNEELGNKADVALVIGNIGSVYWEMGDYLQALEYMAKALAAHEEFGNKPGAALMTGNIGLMYMYMGDDTRALEYYTKSRAEHLQLGMKSDAARVTGNIGIVHKERGDYQQALEYYAIALAAQEELGNKASVARVIGNIGSVYTELGNYSQALEYMTKALSVFEELGNKADATVVTGNIGALYANTMFEGYDPAKAEEILLKALAMSEELGAKRQLYHVHNSLAELYEHQEHWKKANEHNKRYHKILQEVQSEDATRQAQQMEHRRKIEDSERDRQVKLARFQEQEKILHNILPSKIADRMLDGEKTIADSHENVSVFFSDIVGFTTLSQRVSAQELVGMLNGIFTQFDHIARKHGLEKIKTIGDAYMAVCGAPIRVDNHAERTALFALDVVELMNNYQTNAGDKVMIRIGLHSGSVVAGIIGENKFAYDMWGDAVNTASRMESHGEAGKIHVSEEFLKKLLMERNQWLMDNGEWLMEEANDLSSFTINNLPLPTNHSSLTINNLPFTIIPRGEMDIKGKGLMKTYFLEKA
jgi:adenylate cyclase